MHILKRKITQSSRYHSRLSLYTCKYRNFSYIFQKIVEKSIKNFSIAKIIAKMIMEKSFSVLFISLLHGGWVGVDAKNRVRTAAGKASRKFFGRNLNFFGGMTIMKLFKLHWWYDTVKA